MVDCSKWEYKVIKIYTDAKINSQEQLNELGKQGWELVSAIRIEAIPTSIVFILKRKI